MDKIEERRKQRIKRINHLRMGIFAVVIILAFVVGMSVKNVLELSLEQHQLKQENAELKEKKAALEKEFENINDKNYIEEQARKQLNMVKPGEIVYIIEEEQKNGGSGSGESGGNNENDESNEKKDDE